MFKSQNNESELVLNYFNTNYPNRTNTVLSIGENDGITFSNSYDLIERGWNAYLLEPSPKAFSKLKELHKNNDLVKCLNYGIASESGFFPFLESGSFNHNGDDIALYSSLIESEQDRWGDKVAFNKVEAKFLTFEDFLNECLHHVEFDYITIDAEGYDFNILSQINLKALGCKCLCIEHNGVVDLLDKYINYASLHGLFEYSRNAENIIFISK
jgi:FkbM family methyltransferase